LSTNTPQEMMDTFFERFSAHDIEAVLALYEPNAVFVDEPGKVVQGTDAIRESLTAFMAMKPNLKLVKHETLASGDIETNFVKWTLTGTGPDGEPVSMEGAAVDVIRRQPDGGWKFVIDNPWGVAILD